MRPLSVAGRWLACAGLGCGAVSASAQTAGVGASDQVRVTAVSGYVAGRQVDRGAKLPEPPPGPIQSHLVAIPELAGGPAPGNPARSPARAAAATAPESAPHPVVPEQPVVASLTPVVAAPPSPPQSAAPLAAAGPAVVSITYMPQSAEMIGMARSELDRAAPGINRLRHVEVRGYAGGDDPVEARKVALARALSVRSYLIDRGVRTRIDVDAFVSTNDGSAGERVDVVGP